MAAMTSADIRLDHVVVVVTSLADATHEFADAGFTVTPGGRHDAIPTENALVCLADGSYLELLAAREPGTRDELRALRASAAWERHLKGVGAVARRFLPLLAGADGVADWVLRGAPLTRRAAALRTVNVKAAGPVRMSRERTDGERLEWEMLLPESALHPFWIADRTPRERRVPGGDAPSHANGTRGIAAVRVRAASPALATLELGETLGVVPRASGGASVLELQDLRVEVVAGEPAGACSVTLTGCGELPAALAALGILAER